MDFDFKTIKDKDGKPLDTSKVDPAVLAVVAGLAAAIPAGLTEEAVGQLVTAKVTEATAPITAAIDGLSKKLGDPTPPKGKPKDDDDNPVLARLDEIAKSVEAMKGERDAEKASLTTRSVAEAYVAKHFPNLKAKERMIGRLVAAGVKDDATAKKAADAVIEEWKEAGVPVEQQLSASPEGEGGKPGSGGDDKDQAKREKLESLKERRPLVGKA